MNVSQFVSKWIKKNIKDLRDIAKFTCTSQLQSLSYIIVALLPLTYLEKPMLPFKGFTVMEQKILDTLSVSSLSFEDKGIYKCVVNFF